MVAIYPPMIPEVKGACLHAYVVLKQGVGASSQLETELIHWVEQAVTQSYKTT